jgi:hypothetical protein
LRESLADFPKDEQTLFERLLAFEVGSTIPETAIQTLWHSDIDQHQAMILIDRFLDAGLLYRVDDFRVGINRLQHLASRKLTSVQLSTILNESDDVLCRCIDGLGAEAKEFARKVVRSNRGFQLTSKCLRLLGREGKRNTEHIE